METINISALKAKLSAVLKRVKSGQSFAILDRKYKVAVLSPVVSPEAPIKVVHAAEKAVTAPKTVSGQVARDALQALAEDRARR